MGHWLVSSKAGVGNRIPDVVLGLLVIVPYSFSSLDLRTGQRCGDGSVGKGACSPEPMGKAGTCLKS